MLEKQWLSGLLHLPTAKFSSDPGEADVYVCYSRVCRQCRKRSPPPALSAHVSEHLYPSSKYYPDIIIIFLQSSRSYSVPMTFHPLPANGSVQPSWQLSSITAPSIGVTLGTWFYSNYCNRICQSTTQYIWGELTKSLMWGILSGSGVRCLGCVPSMVEVTG